MFGTTGQTYNGKQAMEQILKPAIQYGSLEDYYFKVKTGLKVKEQVFFLRPVRKITIKSQGCNPSSNNPTIEREEKFWQPEPVEARLDICWTELNGQLEESELKGGTEVSNLLGTKVEKILLDLLVPAAYEDLLRMVWLSRKNIVAANLTGGAGDVKNYNQIDGFARKIEIGVGASKIKYHAIAKNAQATAAAQVLAAGEAKTILFNVFSKQSAFLKRSKKNTKVFYVTGSIYENYYNELESTYGALESARTMLLDGTESLTYRGIPLMVLEIVDQFIESDFLVSGAYDKPNRVYMTVKDNFQIGVDTDTSNPIAMDYWYEKKDRKVYFDLQYKLDVQIADEDLVVAAY